MSQFNLPSKWAVARKLVLALPLLALSVVAVPHAHADDHYGRLHHEIREDRRHGDYEEARRDRHELHRREGGYYGGHGYYHDGRYYHHRHSYYRHGHRYYNYLGIVPGGVSLNIGL